MKYVSLIQIEVANRRAQSLLVAPHRQGGQAQFIERPMPVTRSDGRLSPSA